MIMLCLYVGYMVFMFFNRRIESAFYTCTGDVESYNSRLSSPGSSQEDVAEEEKENLLTEKGEKKRLIHFSNFKSSLLYTRANTSEKSLSPW